jgi:hypothetical protein
MRCAVRAHGCALIGGLLYDSAVGTLSVLASSCIDRVNTAIHLWLGEIHAWLKRGS